MLRNKYKLLLLFFILMACAMPSWAKWKMNPHTRNRDYYTDDALSINGVTVDDTAITTGFILKYDGLQLIYSADIGGAGLWEVFGGNTQLINADDIDFQLKKAIDMLFDNGATLPAASEEGQVFIHTPTGRAVKMVYSGGQWNPEVSYGTMTVYVDKTDGTDSLDNGFGADADAFASLQFAIDAIPGGVGGNVTININNETYNENVIIRGKRPSGDYTISVKGTLSLQETVTSATVAAGSGATQGTVTKVGAFAGNSYSNLLCYFVTDNAYRVIDSHTDDVLTLVGTAPSSTAQDIKVYDWGTVINGATALAIDGGQKSVRVYDLKITKPSGVLAFTSNTNTESIFYRCSIERPYLTDLSVTKLESCFVSSSTSPNIFLSNFSKLELSRTKLLGSGGTVGLQSISGGIIILTRGSIIDGYNTNLLVQTTSAANLYSSAANGYVRIRNGVNYGILAKIHGNATSTANVQYSGNGTDELAQAASYGYID